MKEKQRKPSKLAKFLWWTAGADEKILLRSTHSDRVKYFTLGGIILATGLMAALAGGYAFYTIFTPKGDALADYTEVANTVHKAVREKTHWPTALMSSVFGLLWGLMIFNIDRFIVTSTGTGDGTERITWDELKSAIPRLVMGAIIAITISKPVEIRMFKSEIDTELRIAQQEKRKAADERTRAMYEEDKQRLNGEIDKINAEELRLSKLLEDTEKEYSDEITRPGRRGIGPIAESLERQVKMRKAILDKFRKRSESALQKYHDELDQLLIKEDQERKENLKSAAGLDGLLERIKLAHEIAGTSITLFITFLFLAIELTPIFFKLMLIKSPYDYLLENEKELVRARNGIHIEYNYYPPEDDDGVKRHGTERHLVRHLEKEKLTMEQLELLEAQKRLIQYAISKFEASQRELIDQNPEKFIEVSNSEQNNENED